MSIVPPGWPPEVPPPGRPPTPTPAYPPVPIVYEDAPAVDQLAERLLERRIVMVHGRLDAETATDAAARLMLLDATSDDPIELVLSCPDGELTGASALADTIELVGVEVRALCTGLLGGPAVLPFAVATRRTAQPHATFRLVEPRLEVEGRASDLAAETAAHAEAVAAFQRRLAAATGRSVDAVAHDLDRQRSLTADEACAYGLVDEIARRRPLRSV